MENDTFLLRSERFTRRDVDCCACGDFDTPQAGGADVADDSVCGSGEKCSHTFSFESQLKVRRDVDTSVNSSIPRASKNFPSDSCRIGLTD